jgi:hypothetical protein
MIGIIVEKYDTNYFDSMNAEKYAYWDYQTFTFSQKIKIFNFFHIEIVY